MASSKRGSKAAKKSVGKKKDKGKSQKKQKKQKQNQKKSKKKDKKNSKKGKKKSKKDKTSEYSAEYSVAAARQDGIDCCGCCVLCAKDRPRSKVMVGYARTQRASPCFGANYARPGAEEEKAHPS